VTALEFGEQPANLFDIAQPAGVASVSSETYQCQLVPAGCATPEPAPPAYTPPPGAVSGPLPSLGPSRASNGWIAFSTDGQNPGSTDITTGSDIYLVREGGAPTLIAGRAGGTTRNVCPAFSPDGQWLAFGTTSDQGRAIVILRVDANGVTRDAVHLAVPGSGPAVCIRWSSDGTRLGYLDGGSAVIRGMDGSTRIATADDPTAADLQRGTDPSDPLLSPSGEWVARLADGVGCPLVVARADGTAAHIVAQDACGYALATWSPDGRHVLLMEDVSGFDFTMHAIAVDSPFEATIVANVRTNGSRSWPGRGDVSWQPLFP
jgi:Tol biopolymer transport system component